jgi:hypothetical protein
LEIERGPLNYTRPENYIPTTLGAVETGKNGMATLQDGGIYVRNERSSVFFKFLGRERAQDTKQQINFHYSCLYDLLQQPADFPDLNINLKYYKAKIIHLYRTQLQHFKAETQESTILDDEHLPLYHIVARHKRRQNKCITTILDDEGLANTTQRDIQNIFLLALQDRFSPITIQEQQAQRLYSTIQRTITLTDRSYMDVHITPQELKTAIAQAPPQKKNHLDWTVSSWNSTLGENK